MSAGNAYGANPEHHRIVNGQFVCTAPADAPCRTSPTCECENWCCDDPEDHDPGDHCCMATVKAGQGCWIEPWVDAAGLDDSYGSDAHLSGVWDDDNGEVAWPDGPVSCDWADGIYWTYAPAPTPSGGES